MAKDLNFARAAIAIGLALATSFGTFSGLAVGGARPASAADLGGDIPDFEPPDLPSPSLNHYYAGLRGGAVFTNNTEFDLKLASVSTEYGAPGFYGSAMAGYDLSGGRGNGWRLEAELAYLRSSVDTHTVTGLGSLDGTGTRSALIGFANAYYDLAMTENARIFLGGGIGIANVGLNDQGTAPTGTVLNSSATAFAWNLTSGVNLALSSNLDFELGYRYLRIENAGLTAVDGTSNSVDSSDHIVFAGVRYKF